MVAVRKTECHPIKPKVGGSGDPADFIGRRETTTRAFAQLERGQNLILNDPRRMGKTHWLQALEYLGAPFAVVYVDYEGAGTTDAFLLRTVQALHGKQSLSKQVLVALKGFMEMFDVTGTTGFGQLRVRAAWRNVDRAELLRRTVEAVEKHMTGQTILLALDEVPTAIIDVCKHEGQAAAQILLETLRKLRSETRRIRWILCGSVGMHHALREAVATAGVINDLKAVPFGPLDPNDASDLARCLLAGIGVSAARAVVAALVQETDGIPFFMHAVAAVLEEGVSPDLGARAVTADEVSAAATQYLEDRELSHAATHLLTRIDGYYGELANDAYALLDRVALSATPVPLDSALSDDASRTLLDLLMDDQYLVERSADGSGLCWRYPVLQRIWKVRRHLV